mgnify:CR=1 FL=1
MDGLIALLWMSKRLEYAAQNIDLFFFQLRARKQAPQPRHELLRMLGIEETGFDHGLLEAGVKTLDFLVARHHARFVTRNLHARGHAQLVSKHLDRGGDVER